jgi:hypothetical protein
MNGGFFSRIISQELIPYFWRPTPRADIWIPRPRGGDCRETRLTRRGLLADITDDFALLDCGFLDTPPEEPAVHLVAV